MNKKCIYCGKGYENEEDFGHTEIVQTLYSSKIATDSAVFYGEYGEKKIKSTISKNDYLTLAKTVLKILPEKSCLQIDTGTGENEEEIVETFMKIKCCPFCGREFENGTQINND